MSASSAESRCIRGLVRKNVTGDARRERRVPRPLPVGGVMSETHCLFEKRTCTCGPLTLHALRGFGF